MDRVGPLSASNSVRLRSAIFSKLESIHGAVRVADQLPQRESVRVLLVLVPRHGGRNDFLVLILDH